MSEKLNHCKFLDGTDAVQCRWEGPYRYSRNKPSKARQARGNRQTDTGIVRGAYFLQCIPALIKRSHVDSSDAEKYTHDWLIEKQSQCSKYESAY